jgi:hypothetical protein
MRFFKWSSVTHLLAVTVPSISCYVLNHHKLFNQIQNALAINWDTYCHLALCLRLLPFHWSHSVKPRSLPLLTTPSHLIVIIKQTCPCLLQSYLPWPPWVKQSYLCHYKILMTCHRFIDQPEKRCKLWEQRH